MKIVSLVPSWTETLLEAGADVIGRTRFCIHPAERVKSIPIVGGTKNGDWDRIAALKPDLVLMDREENTLEMARACPVPWRATHVRSVHDMPQELRALSTELKLLKLSKMADRWEKVIAGDPRPKDPKSPPAFLEWVTPPLEGDGPVVYVIWAHPWMAASTETFIGSMCDLLGWKLWGADKYPKFDPEVFRDQNMTFLCSTEPYPFAKKRDVLRELPGAVALVDGEKLSWFGLRSLKYLESLRDA